MKPVDSNWTDAENFSTNFKQDGLFLIHKFILGACPPCPWLLAENEKPFFTQSYTNGKDVIVCGHENSNPDNDHCASCFGKYSHNGNW